jgi:hypothetical protein
MELNAFETGILKKLKTAERNDDYIQASDLGYAAETFHHAVLSLLRKGLCEGIETNEIGYVLVRLTDFGRKYVLKI